MRPKILLESLSEPLERPESSTPGEHFSEPLSEPNPVVFVGMVIGSRVAAQDSRAMRDQHFENPVLATTLVGNG